MITRLLGAALFVGFAVCEQPQAPSPIAAPLRDLPWAQLNFLHTSDIHGWWGGHLQEPSYSADWGDYISFAKHLHDRADAEGTDLLLVDTGDRIEGNAIYDSSKPRGKYTYDIAKEQHIDLISSGNHELYKKGSAEGEFLRTVHDFSGNYLASNLDIYSPETGELVPLAPRYKKFKTKNQGIRILAFGYIFDFTMNANNTVIHKVADSVKEDWFQEALDDEDLDLIIVFGHVDIRSPEYKTLFRAIRKVRWNTPIQFFGGHSHIRDFHRFDSLSTALEPGRYMETVGFLSIDGLGSETPSREQSPNVTFSRRYIDKNLYSLQHHSGKDTTTFPTAHGLNVSSMITEARDILGLEHLYGCVPEDLWVNRRPYPHPESIFTWLEKGVLPWNVEKHPRFKDGTKALFITNTGSVRFDIFKGRYTRDTAYLVSPFTSGMRYIKDVPWKAASRVLAILNSDGEVARITGESSLYLEPPEMTAIRFRPYLLDEKPAFVQQRPDHPQTPMTLTPGYTTIDDDGNTGDDTPHTPIQFYNVPNCIQSSIGFDTNSTDIPEAVDLIYNEFIEPFVLMILNYLGEKYNVKDTDDYFPGDKFADLMNRWVGEHWTVGHLGTCDGKARTAKSPAGSERGVRGVFDRVSRLFERGGVV